ncbi:MAG: nuclease [Paenibacillaceae bacterium]|jgi:micrococcal nuclease|nr:nuclease [Paenibacillaceae bacterium]
MKKWGWILCLLLAACSSGHGTSAPVGTPSPGIGGSVEATVTGTIDGDTIQVSVGSRKETVRMILVDTPETKKPGLQEPQPFGKEAAAFTKKLLTGKTVLLERDVSAKDTYGRSLYYVWLDGKMVNRLLLEEGLARVAVFPPDVKYVEDFRSIAAKAQAEGKGIWSLENYVSDRGFRGLPSGSLSPQSSGGQRRK